MNQRRFHALKVDSENAARVFESLKLGEGRFGWSYVESADLRILQEPEKSEDRVLSLATREMAGSLAAGHSRRVGSGLSFEVDVRGRQAWRTRRAVCLDLEGGAQFSRGFP